jgi:hypothetical protein
VLIATQRICLIQELRRKNKLERVAAYHFIAAFNATLSKDLGVSLLDFRIPPNCVIRPLAQYETRMLDPKTGRMAIYNHNTRTLQQEIPAGTELPMCIAFQDQCSIGWSGLHFASAGLQLLTLFVADAFHRDWNSVKAACKSCEV